MKDVGVLLRVFIGFMNAEMSLGVDVFELLLNFNFCELSENLGVLRILGSLKRYI